MNESHLITGYFILASLQIHILVAAFIPFHLPKKPFPWGDDSLHPKGALGHIFIDKILNDHKQRPTFFTVFIALFCFCLLITANTFRKLPFRNCRIGTSSFAAFNTGSGVFGTPKIEAHVLG